MSKWRKEVKEVKDMEEGKKEGRKEGRKVKEESEGK
jgi:hypothetical protein